jgi:hypothetical protein
MELVARDPHLAELDGAGEEGGHEREDQGELDQGRAAISPGAPHSSYPCGSMRVIVVAG